MAGKEIVVNIPPSVEVARQIEREQAVTILNEMGMVYIKTLRTEGMHVTANAVEAYMKGAVKAIREGDEAWLPRSC